MQLISWLPAIAASIHITEEFVWPGGFKQWYISYRPEYAPNITNRFLVLVNALLLGATVNIALAGTSPQGVAAWLTVVSVMFSNALFHLRAVLRTRKYSPGVISGLLLYIPLAAYGFRHFLGNGQVSAGTALIAFAIGGSYQFISAGGHRVRSGALSRSAAM